MLIITDGVRTVVLIYLLKNFERRETQSLMKDDIIPEIRPKSLTLESLVFQTDFKVIKNY